MASRPLQIAFTALTLSLVVSLSLWVMHASYEQIQFSRAVTLQVPSAPAEINSDEVRENLRPDPSSANPFSEIATLPQMVELDELPKLEGIETETVSQHKSAVETPRSIPSRDEFPELSIDPLTPVPPIEEPPLDLPELSLTEPANDVIPEIPQLDPTSAEQPEPPLVELTLEPLTAPRPPAWLSVQATLEAEIETLQQQLQSREAALAKREQEAQDWNIKQKNWLQTQQDWDKSKSTLTEKLLLYRHELAESQQDIAASRKELQISQQQLVDSREQIDRLRSLLEQSKSELQKSQSETEELKSELRAKSAQIGRMENDARRTRQQIADLLDEGKSVRDLVRQEHDVEPLTRIAEIPNPQTVRPVLPLPDESTSSLRDEVFHQEPIPAPAVSQLADQPGPPDHFRTTQPRLPLIPAETGYGEPTGAPGCLDDEPKKKGLIYDLKDWYHDWHDSNESCTTCEPMTVRKADREEVGLIPDLAYWWTHRLTEWD